jgi:phosphoglycolate phosphatase-like HAD superfamily hydrolase
MFVVLDLDETLADCAHRAHFVEKGPKNWDAFFAPDLVFKDPVVKGAERVLAHFADLKYDLVVLTGRDEDLRDTTMRWLLEKLNISLPDGHLLMRQVGNMLNAAEYKREQLMNFKNGLENKNNDFLIIDDDADAGVALRDLGTVLKAPECWALLFSVPVPVSDEE